MHVRPLVAALQSHPGSGLHYIASGRDSRLVRERLDAGSPLLFDRQLDHSQKVFKDENSFTRRER